MARQAKAVIRQRRVPGMARIWGSGGLLPGVEDLIAADARRFHVSRSFVRATILTQHYERVMRTRFQEQERFQEVGRTKLRRVS